MRAKLVLVLLAILAAAAVAPSPYPVGTRLFLTVWMIFFSWPALRMDGRKNGWFLYALLIPLWVVFDRYIFPDLGYALAIAWVVLFPVLRLFVLRKGWTRGYDWHQPSLQALPGAVVAYNAEGWKHHGAGDCGNDLHSGSC